MLAIGNHELYIYNNTLDMHTNFAPHWNGRYLSSNVNITVNNANTGETFAYLCLSVSLTRDAQLSSVFGIGVCAMNVSVIGKHIYRSSGWTFQGVTSK